MIWKKFGQWTAQYVRAISYATASLFVTTWTLLRFFTQRTIFDLVGQQVLAGQWLHGNFGTAGIGATNYIPKMFLLYMPLELIPGSPRLKLIILTALVNIATIVLIGLLMEKTLHGLGVKVGPAFYATLIWLSAIAGSVFWVQFTNSRNLEVVGGLLLLYLALRFFNNPSRQLLIGITLLSAGLFFADTLQFYMTAIPVLAYGTTLALCRRTSLKSIIWLGGGILFGLLGSKLLFVAAEHLLSLHILGASGGSSLSPHFLLGALWGTTGNFLRLYSGGVDGGRLREAVNILWLALMATGLGYALIYQLVPRRVALLAGYLLSIDSLVYIASGQAAIPATQRYLIMTAPALMLLFGSLGACWQHFRHLGTVAICTVIGANGLLLGRALITGSQQHFSQDKHLASVTRDVATSPNTLFYASADTALPMAYLRGSDRRSPLPVTCNSTVLTKDDTFYSRTAYRAREAGKYRSVAIVLDGQTITNVPHVCNLVSITDQFGKPKAIAITDDGSTVLFYDPAILTKLDY